MRRKSTGETIEKDRKGGASWADFAFPNWWHYDVLRGLDYLRDAGVTHDARVAEAIDVVRKKGDPWKAEAHSPGVLPVDLDEDRWISLRARRVLRWAGTLE